MIGLSVLRVVGCVRASMAANRGEFYRYPLCIRFIADPPESKEYACDDDGSEESA